MNWRHPLRPFANLSLIGFAVLLLTIGVALAAPSTANPIAGLLAREIKVGADFVSRDANKWVLFRAREGETVKIRVRAPGGRPTVTIYRDKLPGGLVVAFGSDLQGTGVAEVVFVAPRTTRYTVRVESGSSQGFTFSYLRPEDVSLAANNAAPFASSSPPPAPEVSPAVVAPAAGPRVALVVGIGAYGSLGDLANPLNDASSLAAALREVGFEVDLVLDADQRALRQAVARLGERMAAAGSGATGLFFFAGHGIQSRGVNFLVPARAAIVREADLALEAVPADAVLLQMQEAEVSTNILILDACRNMPFTRSFRSAARGLAQMDAPNGSFIAYSTAPGAIAADGSGQNSPFAAALAREIVRPGQPIEAVFRNVRRAVLQNTGGLQTPWDSSSLVEPFYFKGE